MMSVVWGNSSVVTERSGKWALGFLSSLWTAVCSIFSLMYLSSSWYSKKAYSVLWFISMTEGLEVVPLCPCLHLCTVWSVLCLGEFSSVGQVSASILFLNQLQRATATIGCSKKLCSCGCLHVMLIRLVNKCQQCRLLFSCSCSSSCFPRGRRDHFDDDRYGGPDDHGRHGPVDDRYGGPRHRDYGPPVFEDEYDFMRSGRPDDRYGPRGGYDVGPPPPPPPGRYNRGFDRGFDREPGPRGFDNYYGSGGGYEAYGDADILPPPPPPKGGAAVPERPEAVQPEPVAASSPPEEEDEDYDPEREAFEAELARVLEAEEKVSAVWMVLLSWGHASFFLPIMLLPMMCELLFLVCKLSSVIKGRLPAVDLSVCGIVQEGHPASCCCYWSCSALGCMPGGLRAST